MKHQAPNLKQPAARSAVVFDVWNFSGAWMLVLGCFLLSGGWCFVLGASLELNVTPKFSGELIQPDSLRYKTSAGENFSITRISYLLGGFALQRPDGSWLELTNEVAWFDLERGRSSHRVASVPSDSYTSIRFHIGLDEKLNHADPAQFPADHPLNPNLNGLHWNWQGGYIFLALEGMWQPVAAGILPAVEPGILPGGTNAATTVAPRTTEYQSGRQDAALYGNQDGRRYDGWSYHFARDTNRTRITLAAPLNLTNDTKLELDFDLAALLNAPRPLSFGKDGSSTHSREGDPIAVALGANLPGAFQVSRISEVISTQSAIAQVKPIYLPAKFTPYPFKMSSTFPIPDLPRDNPLIEERVALGEKLFNETALSKDGTISCASCHDSKHAFTDPRQFSVGVRGQVGTRNGMPLFNLAWKSSFFWDGRAPSLRAQALMPIQDHAEMDESLTNVVRKLIGMKSDDLPLTPAISPSEGARDKHSQSSDDTNVVSGLAASQQSKNVQPLSPLPFGRGEGQGEGTLHNYPALFAAAFGSPEITPEKIGLAIENYLLTLTSFDSKFDRVLKGEAKFTAAEQRGLELFMTEYDPRREQFGADCFHCHGGALFSDHQFHNNGQHLDERDMGRFKVTKQDADKGRFSTPSLRNIALTAPYMHDGKFRSLEEVVAHYDHGVRRTATLDPNLAKHPDGGIRLNEADKKALVAFLRTLTDEKHVK